MCAENAGPDSGSAKCPAVQANSKPDSRSIRFHPVRHPLGSEGLEIGTPTQHSNPSVPTIAARSARHRLLGHRLLVRIRWPRQINIDTGRDHRQFAYAPIARDLRRCSPTAGTGMETAESGKQPQDRRQTPLPRGLGSADAQSLRSGLRVVREVVRTYWKGIEGG